LRPLASLLSKAARQIDPALEISLFSDAQHALSPFLAAMKTVSIQKDEKEVAAIKRIKGHEFARSVDASDDVSWKWTGNERLIEDSAMLGTFKGSEERMKWYRKDRDEKDAFRTGLLYGFEFYGPSMDYNQMELRFV
jgi:hypothetical protein